MKTLVLYVFHEYNARVDTFFKTAIFEDPSVDFLVICNSLIATFEVPSYVRVIKRENIGYDFGGWSEGILQSQPYDYYIFLNSSVSGPFVPPYYTGRWTSIYLNGLKDGVKLFGSTINTIYDPYNMSHVQSYAFAMDRETLEFLIDYEIFSTTNYAKTWTDAIWKKEILMSRMIIQKGWNIGCLLSCYRGVDFTFKTPCAVTEWHDDIMFAGFENKLWSRYELVFIKGNRVC